jgi:hypothetical protein
VCLSEGTILEHTRDQQGLEEGSRTVAKLKTQYNMARYRTVVLLGLLTALQLVRSQCMYPRLYPADAHSFTMSSES